MHIDTSIRKLESWKLEQQELKARIAGWRAMKRLEPQLGDWLIE